MPSDILKNLNEPSLQETAREEPQHSSKTQDAQLYLLGEVGHIYAYSVYPSNSTAEPMCTLLGLTVDDDEFRLEIDGREFRERACIAAPQTSTMLPCESRTVAFAFYPPTATHRALQMLPTPRVKPLDRERFREFDDALVAAVTGTLSIDQALALFNSVADVAGKVLPSPPPLDARIATVVRALFADVTFPIDDLAKLVRLSADRLSHLFTEMVGIDLRRYRLWLKIGRASLVLATNPDTNLSEVARLAGFSDSAHLSRAVKEVYGGAPSRFLAGMKIHGPA
jgi:AraC-like DNA-binding protein